MARWQLRTIPHSFFRVSAELFFGVKEGSMVNQTLSGTRVAILVTDGFEEVELVQPRRALDDAGATTNIISPKQGQVRSWRSTEWGENFPVDVNLSSADPADYEALLLP